MPRADLGKYRTYHYLDYIFLIVIEVSVVIKIILIPLIPIHHGTKLILVVISLFKC